MKYSILLITLLLFNFVFSQSILINWAEDNFESYNGDTVEIGSTTDVIFTDFYVVNNANASSFIWQRKVISHSGQSFSDQLCDDQLCHEPYGQMWTASFNMPVDVGDSTLFEPKLLTNGNAGTGHHRYYVLDQTEKMLDSIDVIFNSTLSVNTEKLTDNDVVVYPNPSDGEINFIINNENVKQPYNVSIKDALGKTVCTTSIDSSKKSNIAGLNKGIYFAVIHSDSKNDVVTKKFIVR